jgi:broad specificity phosphatase PhoE
MLLTTSRFAPARLGESLLMVAQRVGALLRDALHEYDGKTIVVIGHRATKYALEYWCGDAPHTLGVARNPHLAWRYELRTRHFEQRSVG